MNQIDKELRHAIMRLVYRVIDVHPAAGEATDHNAGDPANKCGTCYDVTEVLRLLDAEQREYGSPIDVTDPSYIRMKALGR